MTVIFWMIIGVAWAFIFASLYSSFYGDEPGRGVKYGLISVFLSVLSFVVLSLS